jgi:hypothetical protein
MIGDIAESCLDLAWSIGCPVAVWAVWQCVRLWWSVEEFCRECGNAVD